MTPAPREPAKIFVPRPWQKPMVAHLTEHKRCALWAGMGVGKTAAILAAVEILQMVEDVGKILVVAPLRVARTTWADEAARWEQFRGLEVVPIIGSLQERLRALRTPGRIYTVNYENLEWLVKTCKDDWEFKTVVADESTRLKSLRLSFRKSKTGKTFLAGQGGSRARALGRVAHSKVDRFYELTGTPSPNGLKDLWGQIWFLDGGVRLGRTYEAFTQRWFRQGYDGFSLQPLPHAEKEIYAALADICLTIDGADWFDLREPIFNNVYIDLPARARKLYQDMETEMFMALGDRTVEAFGAAARTQKCLAGGTEILTRTGWAKIEDFTPGEELWDGVEWVTATGLVCNGYKSVVDCWGVSMTPDHRVLTTSGWSTAKEILDGKPSERPNRATVRLPDGDRASGEDAASSEPSLVARPMRLREGSGPHRPMPDPDHSWEEEVLWLPSEGDAPRGVGLPRDVGTPRLARVVWNEVEMRQPQRQELAQLRWAGNHGLRSVATFFRELLGGHGPHIPRRVVRGAAGQHGGLLSTELPVGNTPAAGKQPQNVRVYRHPTREDVAGAGRPEVQPEADHALQAGGERVDDAEAAGAALVYDIVDAGPRNRFTVRGRGGEVFLAHNCHQVANGGVYLDPLCDGEESKRSKDWALVHDEKIAALESVFEEANGAPVLVAYKFKSDLARLLKAFPRGRHLKTKQDEDDFKAGKIPYLFFHPQSAGHGIDGFQHVCNIICFFSVDWNLEEYQQSIGRIGPVRQMQAGLDRAVYVHHIVARDTIDEIVLERQKSKRDVQDLLLDAMKRRHKR